MPQKEISREYPEVLKDLADLVAECMVESGEEPVDAARIGLRAAEYIRVRWGGGKIYIPKASLYLCSQRDREIFELWNGANPKELAGKYGLTEARIYQIVAAVRQERRAKRALGKGAGLQ